MSTVTLQEQCCGAYNYSDYDGWTQVINTDPSITAQVPISCCKRSDPESEADAPTGRDDFVNLQGCLNRNLAYINEKVFTFTALTEHH